MNLFTKQNLSQRCRKQTYTYQKISRGEINWETGIDIYMLLYIKQIISKDLQYSTGNSTQYSVTACTRKESKKRVDICICITDSLCYTAETNTTLQLDYTPIKSFKKKRYAHPYVHISTIHDSQDVETTYMSTDH